MKVQFFRYEIMTFPVENELRYDCLDSANTPTASFYFYHDVHSCQSQRPRLPANSYDYGCYVCHAGGMLTKWPMISQCDIVTNILTENCPIGLVTSVAENCVKYSNTIGPDDTDTAELLDNADKHND